MDVADVVRIDGGHGARGQAEGVVVAAGDGDIPAVARQQAGVRGEQVGGSNEGISLDSKARVLDLMKQSLPLTLQLAALALFFAMLVALPLGVAAPRVSGIVTKSGSGCPDP